MTDTEKVARIKALIEEVKQLSKELTEEELEQVAGGLPFELNAPVVYLEDGTVKDSRLPLEAIL
ncbi:MAG: bacteriocin [Coriobacteriales bacterium]|jgi:bacteriocin-like protein|nr:bacteriocin [Coriobacteriales bacterium]